MKFALKESNLTIEALSKGLITAIWKNSKEYQSFNHQKQLILFPTLIHKELGNIRDEFRFLSDNQAKPNKDNQVKIRYWAEIEKEINIENLNQLLSISKELIYTDEYLQSSWDSNQKGEILIVRTYKLSNPVLITNSQEYANNKPYIELKVDIPRVGSDPVLSYKEFSQRVKLIKNLLEEASLVTS